MYFMIKGIRFLLASGNSVVIFFYTPCLINIILITAILQINKIGSVYHLKLILHKRSFATAGIIYLLCELFNE